MPAIATRGLRGRTSPALVRRAAWLVGAIALLVLLPGRTADHPLQTLVPWFVAVLLLQFAPLFLSDDPDLFAPPVLTGIVGGFGTLATLVSFYVAGEVKIEALHVFDPDEVAAVAQRALWATLLGLVGYYLGYYPRLGRSLRGIFPKVAGLVWDRRRLVLATMVPILAFIAAYWTFQSKLGVSIFDPTQLGAGKAVWREDPTLSWMMRGIELGLLPVLLWIAWSVSARRGVISLVGPGLALLIMGILVTRLGQRGTAAYVLVVVLVLFHYHRRRLPALLFAVVYFVGLAVGNALLEWRTSSSSSPRGFDVIASLANPADVLAAHEGERQRFASLAIVMSEFPENHPYLLGESWLPIIALPVPRWLWPEKVEHFEWQDNRIVFKLTGIAAPTPFVGVLYANLSWIGIFVGMFLLGLFHRALYEWRALDPGDVNVVLIYALFLVYFAPTMIGLSESLQYILPIWFFLRFVGRRPAHA